YRLWTLLHGFPFHHLRVSWNGPDRDRYRAAETEHQRHGGRSLSWGRSATRQWFFALLHGHKHWRPGGAARRWLSGENANFQKHSDLLRFRSQQELALGIRGGRYRNDN